MADNKKNLVSEIFDMFHDHFTRDNLKAILMVSFLDVSNILLILVLDYIEVHLYRFQMQFETTLTGKATDEYMKGAWEFVEKVKKDATYVDLIMCPCKDCRNMNHQSFELLMSI
uniref:Transposase-associated domain-containing protein n=1 Tax=Cucumis melo TaxID=3656 RepID=A0A9I9EKA0_CUCME